MIDTLRLGGQHLPGHVFVPRSMAAACSGDPMVRRTSMRSVTTYVAVDASAVLDHPYHVAGPALGLQLRRDRGVEHYYGVA